MATIPLIGSDEIENDLWDTLFAELDTKVARAMDNKCLVMLCTNPETFPDIADVKRVMGMLFMFVNGPRPQSLPFGGSNYNHQPFLDAAAALEATIYDADAKIVQLNAAVPSSYRDQVDMGDSPIVNPIFFHRSLQAHRKYFQEVDKDPDQYWLIEQATFHPEKRYRYAQAEIIIEGIGFETFQIQAIWDKYNFFRIHNCNPYAVTVSFGGRHTVTIERWESKCVRRTAVAGTYTDGYRYFHKFLTDDPRVFYMPQSNVTPAGSMGANNVISPTIAYRVIELFTGSLTGPKLWVDPHALYDVAALYADHFVSITDNTLIGDLLHHKGKLVRVAMDGAGAIAKHEFEFDGYREFKATAASNGITVTEDAGGTLTIQAADLSQTQDLWAIGTNLLNKNGLKPVVNLNTAFTLVNSIPSSNAVRPVVTGPLSQFTYEYSLAKNDNPAELAATKTVTLTVDYAGYVVDFGAASTSLSIHGNTLGQAKSLDAWGDGSISGQSTNRGAFTDREFVLTPFGLTLKFNQRIPLNRGPLNKPAGAVLPVVSGMTIDGMAQDVSLAGSTLVFAYTIVFSGYGWPTLAAPTFVGPRFDRIVSDVPAKPLKGDESLVRHHPNVGNQPFGRNGEDFTVIGLDQAEKEADMTGITALVPLTAAYPPFGGWLPENPFDFPIFAAPDVLDEFLRSADSEYSGKRALWLQNVRSSVRMIRMDQLREHYNSLASYINAIKKCRPFTFADWRFPFEGGVATLTPNSTGPFGGKYRPANSFASFARDSRQWRIVRQLGIQIRTKNDLPASYQTVKAAKEQSFALPTEFTHAVTGTRHTLVLPYYWRTTETVKQRLGATTVVVVDGAHSLLTPAIFEGAETDETYYWVKVEDVQAFAEANGFLFHLERTVIPFTLKVFTADPDSVARRANDESISYTSTTEVYFFAGEPPNGDFGPVVMGQNFGSSISAPPSINSKFAAMVESITDSEVEWVRDMSTVRTIDYRAGDVYVTHVPIISGWNAALKIARGMPANVFFTLDFGVDGYRFLRRSGFGRAHTLTDVTQFASVLHQAWVSTGLERTAKLIQVPAPYVRHTTQTFSEDSLHNAFAFQAHGLKVIPLQVVNPTAAPVGENQPY